MENLEALLRSRYHGAYNLKGIEFQLLYSVYKSLDLFSQSGTIESVRLEGIEDIDLIGFSLDNEFIQVKTSITPWKWSQLKSPISNFLEALEKDKSLNFTLAVNFSFKSKIIRLANYKTLQKKEKKAIKKDFTDLCKEVGYSTEDAELLIDRINLVSENEGELFTKLRTKVVDAFDLSSEAVDIFILALIAKFLEWAKKRKTLTREDLEEFRLKISESIARETSFEAYGRSLVTRIQWFADKNTNEFIEGKSTRPGHIVVGADVRREAWLLKIDKSFEKGNVCILRSSSGQGKSALAYRYAFEFWPHENSFILNSSETAEQVALIADYLKFRHGIGIPTFLVIENAGFRNRLWSDVVQVCSSLGIPVLVASRVEDWYRFSQESIATYEIIEPYLSLDEARKVYMHLKGRGGELIHQSVVSAEWAYEEIGTPSLLIEYIYLLTHGQLLKDRLRDQFKQFNLLDEDSTKKEILRIVALADVCGAPVDLIKLAENLDFNQDPQDNFESLNQEYLRIENDRILGLHSVRSEHIVNLLHGSYPKPINTAFRVLTCIPLQSVNTFITNFVNTFDYGDVNEFVKVLADLCGRRSFSEKMLFIDALFSAGEQIYFKNNEELFIEAYIKYTANGAKCLAWDLFPMLNKSILSELGKNFNKITEIYELAKLKKDGPRGLDLVKGFISEIIKHITQTDIELNLSLLGFLLDWCYLCEVSIPIWDDIKDLLLESNEKILSFSIDSFCGFAFGLYRYDEGQYWEWFKSNQANIISYLKFNTDTVFLQLSEDKKIASIRFLPKPVEKTSLNNSAVKRLEFIRLSLPFCEQYNSDCIYLLPTDLKPSVDDAHKEIPIGNLLPKYDIEKNVVFRNIVDVRFTIDNSYSFQNAWNNLRTNLIRFLDVYSEGLKYTLSGRTDYDWENNLKKTDIILELTKAFDRLPLDPPQSTSEELKKEFKYARSNWVSHLNNFLHLLIKYSENIEDKNTGRLVVHNMYLSIKDLPQMQGTFKEYFKIFPDYFNVLNIEKEEIRVHSIASEIVNVWILEPPMIKLTRPMEYIHQIREDKRRQTNLKLQDLRTKLLEERGIDVAIPSNSFVDFPLVYCPIGYTVSNVINFSDELDILFEELKNLEEVAHFYYLIPIFQGERFTTLAHRISTSSTQKQAAWESYIPTEIPSEIIDLLPLMPLHISNHKVVFDQLLGLKFAKNALQQVHNLFSEYFSNQATRFDVLHFQELEKYYLSCVSEILTTTESLRLIISETYQIFQENANFSSLDNSLLEFILVLKDRKLDNERMDTLLNDSLSFFLELYEESRETIW